MTDGHVVKAMYDALAAGDVQQFTDLLHPDVVWTVPGNHDLSGTFGGTAELFAHLAEVVQRTGGNVKVDVKEILEGDRHTVAVVEVDMAVDGRTVHDHQVHVFQLRDGRIRSVREFHGDEKSFDDLFGARRTS